MAFRSSPDAVAILSVSDERIMEVNDGFEQITGYQREEVLGRTSDELSLWVDSHTRTELVQTLKDQGSVRDLEFDIRKKSGEIRTCQVSAELANIADMSCMVSVTKDITERLERESQLFQAQKMETVGQLTGGIAHDFNNLLTVIRGNLRLLQEDLESAPEDDVGELIEDALSATDDGEELTRRLLSFSRRKSLEPRRLDVHRVIEDFRRLLRRTLGENIQLELNLSSGVAVASADRAHLESALLNLAVNARDAMPSGGSLTIETDRKTLVQEALVEFPELDIGSYVTITVSDTGTGMEPEVVAKACEPFFTTKESDKGSGLGLSMVYDFVKRAGGALIISSIPAQGTDVTMLLPESSSDIEEDRRSDHKANLPRGHETVLVAEDRPEVRRFAVRSLESQGYRVLQASDGMGAMKVLEADNSIEVLFSDVIMPGGMNGDELAKWALKQFPHIKVLLTTASSSEIQETMSSHGDDIHWLGKPYSRDELAQRIRSVLDTGIHRV